MAYAKYDWLPAYEAAMAGNFGDPNDPNQGGGVLERIKAAAGKDFEDALAAGIITPDGGVDWKKAPSMGPSGFELPKNTMYSPVGGRAGFSDAFNPNAPPKGNVYHDPNFGDITLIQQKAPLDWQMKLGRAAGIAAFAGPAAAALGGAAAGALGLEQGSLAAKALTSGIKAVPGLVMSGGKSLPGSAAAFAAGLTGIPGASTLASTAANQIISKPKAPGDEKMANNLYRTRADFPDGEGVDYGLPTPEPSYEIPSYEIPNEQGILPGEEPGVDNSGAPPTGFPSGIGAGSVTPEAISAVPGFVDWLKSIGITDWATAIKVVTAAGGVAAAVQGIQSGKLTAQTIMNSIPAQAAANSQAAIQQNTLNNPNIVGPYGSQTWTVDPTTGRPTATQTLSPEQQALYNQQVGLAGQSNQIAGQLNNQFAETLKKPFGLEGAPGTVDLSKAGPIQGSVNLNSEGIQKGLNLDAAGKVQYSPGEFGAIQNGLDYSGAPAMPVANKEVRDQVSQAFYNQGAALLDPQFRDQQSDLDAMLANQGIVRNPTAAGEGPSAWQREQDNIARQKEQAYNDLAQRAIIQGGNAMEQLYGMEMGARQQGVGEINTQGNFANAAQNQGAQQLLAKQAGYNQAQAQAAGQIATQGNFVNAAQNQGANQALAAGTFANTAQGQGAQQMLSQQAANNQARGQQYNEMTGNFLTPLNARNAFISTGQATVPQFPSPGQTSVQPVNVMAPTIAASNAQQSGYGQAYNLLSRGVTSLWQPG